MWGETMIIKGRETHNQDIFHEKRSIFNKTEENNEYREYKKFVFLAVEDFEKSIYW